MNKNNHCIACGDIIPEGRQVCTNCENTTVTIPREEYEKLQQSYVVKAYDKLRAENKTLKGDLESLRQEIITLSQELINSRKETAKDILYALSCTPIDLLGGAIVELSKRYGVEIG